MKFIFGLGNPGQQYKQTRHNIGFEVVTELARELTPSSKFLHNKKLVVEIIKTTDLILAKPQTFMNQSGQAVRAVLDFYEKRNFKKNRKLELRNLLVIHDDLDLRLGSFKIQFGKGPKIHQGLLSIYNHLGTDQFWHVRLGVDNRDDNRSLLGRDYVLSKFSPLEKKIVAKISAQVSMQLHNLVNIRLVEK